MYSLLQHISSAVMTPDGVYLYSSVLSSLSSRVSAEVSECCQLIQIFDLMQVLL